ncbi:MAG: 4Fe-4S binding protein [Candidatus Bathyarchaeota archaeon]|nr:4Fe-4S binding protein [Candidatus Bathyarchaeota archaeon]MDH5787503.1 4Fe-4S binding protein [Candidatus Bathyarchaeota archaeon]
MIRTCQELQALQNSLLNQRDPNKQYVRVCVGTGCRARGSLDVLETFKEEIRKQSLEIKVESKQTGCHGFCERGPVVVIGPKEIFYQQVKATDVNEIVSKTLLNGEFVDRLLYQDSTTGQKVQHEHEVPFYKMQTRRILANNGRIDPTNILDYIAVGGYQALAKAISNMSQEEIINAVEKSGLRGLGGGGFPTGRKWRTCREASGDIKFVIGNGDEGDPGAFSDRSLMEANPHSILEGMIIGAYAIGANQGFLYVRAEYPLALKHLQIAIDQAKEYGFLGKNILNYGFDFDIKIVRGGGAFVCGESSALVASIEGRMGEPRAKYIHTVERGLWNKPTNLNNVKTWACIPLIVNNGADWYAKTGTGKSKGTAVFSLVGKVNNTGLIEVPMGTPLKQIIYDVGGGVPEGKKIKAVQTGGPSGGCIPEELLDLPVDFDKLTEAGSMMGSGGMIVMDENTCMVDVARYFLDFLQYESCGKCVPCREGIKRMLEILTGITEGRGRGEDLGLLQELAEMIKDFSLCGLGQTSPNTVLSTLRYFGEEYQAHVKEKRCPAGVCRSLIEYTILEDKCTGCGACLKLCPQQAIQGEQKKLHVIDPTKCIRCGICRDSCPFIAITVR